MPNTATEVVEAPREIVKKIADAAIELAFTRHELTTTEYEGEEFTDVEEGVEAFKALVEEVKSDVFACLTGDEEGCLDPEDVDYDNELEWLKRRIATALAAAEAKGDKAGFERAREAAAAVVCPWCGDDQYDLVWHHEEWRHYRNSDQHVEYCKSTAIRSLSVEPPASVEGEK
jgi:hypothetical protein